ncbi:IDI-3 protein [Colletotrichum orchidophilum]|uniref:IDI-3 protein n=1 Tax=Colletotrichum orchidophilum TaxID=1209926 RepID=A0A1G4B6X7_9PEZI|nr:IDI-3 protein [Colletotrichum orchidophilum]OHE97199.1 IDI-3 protein [Colletotrichum orchidophilum]
MFPKKILAVLLAATSALAFPLQIRQGSTYFNPSATYTYNVGTGAITPSSGTGVVSKSTSDGGNDLTALLTFTYPPDTAGKKCQLYFYLDGPTSSVSGSGKLDVFTSIKPAPSSGSSGWGAGGPGNQRDVNIGRLSAVWAGFATWDATYKAYLTAPTDCNATGTVQGLELVGVSDNDHVSWNTQVSGARIYYS